MRRLATLLLLCVAAGCARLSDMDSDAFAQGGASQEMFMLDSAGCKQAADNESSYSLRGISADNADKHRLFNRAYAACMKAKGYKERTHWFDFWQAYDV